MRVAIVGAGALGSLFGGILSQHDHEVWLYNPSNIEHIEAIKSAGLVIETPDGELHVEPHATTRVDKIPLPVDLVGIFVKTYNTELALKATMSLIGSESWVLSLQNGVGSEDVISRLLDRGLLLRGVTAQGATYLASGRVRWGGRGPTRVCALTELTAEQGDALRNLCSNFADADWACEIVNDIEPLLWEKLIVNAGINPLTALFDVPNGELLTNENLRAIMAGLVQEAHAVAQKHGIAKSLDEVRKTVEGVCERTGSNISSMLQDVRRGKQTEVEYINGAVAEEGKKLGIETPLNRLVLELLMKS